jgi:HK97 family phage major capsid protein
MNPLEALRRERGELIEKSGVILSGIEPGEVLNEAQAAECDAFDARIAEINPTITRLEAHRERERLVVGDVPGVDLTAASPSTTPVDANKGPCPYPSFGAQLQDIATAYTAPQGTPPPAGLMEIQAATGAGEGSPSDGGFLVQTDFSQEIRDGIMAAGELMKRVFMIPISSGANSMKMNAIDETSRVDGSRWGGVRAYWLAEAGSLTATRPKFREITMTLHKLGGLFYATDELLGDAGALERIARAGFETELMFKAEDAIFRGDGSGKPLGFLNAPCTISQAKEGGQTATTIVFENIIKMWSRMPSRSRANAVWLINQDIEPQLMQMFLSVGTGGVPVYMPANGVVDSPFARLLGRPVIPVEYAPTLGSKGDINLVDLSHYLGIEKGSATWASSMHVQFLTDEMTFRIIWRLDGQPSLASALTPYQGTTTLSPFVNLAARA